MRRVLFVLPIAVLLTAGVGSAQVCTEEVSSGYFDVEFTGAFFDGSNTEFEYCVTNNGGNALSHWVLALDLGCIDPEDLVDCGPEPCFFQENDPTTGVTGIKWDDTQVETGETECFDFTLVGDWTTSLGEVGFALKAGANVFEEEICGPVCASACETNIELLRQGNRIGVGVRILHNRPPTVVRTIEFAILDMDQRVVHRWSVGPITFRYRELFEYSGAVPNLDSLKAGGYLLVMRLHGMSGWLWQTKPFWID